MAKSEIQWTDWTFNPVTGCDRVSAGCDHCYALALAARLKAMGNVRYQVDGNPKTSGPGFGVTLHPDKLVEPLSWRKPQRVFVNSMSDLFHADVPDQFIADLFAVMALARRHAFQVLTKRPQRMHRLVADRTFHAMVMDAYYDIVHRRQLGRGLSDSAAHVWPLHNVWLGVSVENQEAAYRIDWLVRTPAAVRFISAEPLLGLLDLFPWFWADRTLMGHAGHPEECPEDWEPAGDIHWLITGGESGPNHRPCDPAWVRSIRDQCVAADVAYFHKQWGGRTPKAGGRLLDGREWNEMPEVAS